MSNRLLSSLNLPPLILAQLQQSHYNTAADVLELSITQLANDINATNEDANYIQKLIQTDISAINATSSIAALGNTDIHDSSNNHGDDFRRSLKQLTGLSTGQSALQLLRADMNTIPLTSNCTQIDDILGGGFYPHTLNEIVGVPGIGKSQLMMQLSCTIQLPKLLGGLGSKCIYIDTEGSIMTHRMEQIATAFIQQLRDKCMDINNTTQEQRTAVSLLTSKSLLSNIKYIRIYDHIELIASIGWLSLYLQDNTDIRLVIIDSIAFHFRSGFNSSSNIQILPQQYGQPSSSSYQQSSKGAGSNIGREYNVRNKLLSMIGTDLQKLATERDCIVCIAYITQIFI
jgi:RecA/RadA recombinase